MPPVSIACDLLRPNSAEKNARIIISSVAMYRMMRLRFGYGFESCDANGPQNVKNLRPCEKELKPVFSTLLPVGSQKIGSNAYKRGQFHAAIRATSDNETLRFVCPNQEATKDHFGHDHFDF